MTANGGLTPKQARFVAEYLVDLNATQAAIRAGYSKKVAAQQGHENLMKPEIAAAIAEGQTALMTKLGTTAEDTIHANRCIIDADVAALYGPTGKLLHPTRMPRDLRRAITRIKMRVENVTAGDGHQDTTVEVWFEPKGPAIDRDYKRHQLCVEQVDLTVNMGIVERLQRARQRGDIKP
jgi:phage terminase small subunit